MKIGLTFLAIGVTILIVWALGSDNYGYFAWSRVLWRAFVIVLTLVAIVLFAHEFS
jgi:hypothetical protein